VLTTAPLALRRVQPLTVLEVVTDYGASTSFRRG
jgi:hypothetical protein